MSLGIERKYFIKKISTYLFIINTCTAIGQLKQTNNNLAAEVA